MVKTEIFVFLSYSSEKRALKLLEKCSVDLQKEVKNWGKIKIFLRLRRAKLLK